MSCLEALCGHLLVSRQVLRPRGHPGIKTAVATSSLRRGVNSLSIVGSGELYVGNIAHCPCLASPFSLFFVLLVPLISRVNKVYCANVHSLKLNLDGHSDTHMFLKYSTTICRYRLSRFLKTLHASPFRHPYVLHRIHTVHTFIHSRSSAAAAVTCTWCASRCSSGAGRLTMCLSRRTGDIF